MIIEDDNTVAQTILHYRVDPRFISCPRAYVVTGVPNDAECDKHNRALLQHNETGYWKIGSENEITQGDAVFLILPNQNQSEGYPREVYGGVITDFVYDATDDGRDSILVEKFFALSDVQISIKNFLLGATPPQGNNTLNIKQWEPNSTSEQEIKIFEKEIIHSQKSSQEARLKCLKEAEQIPQKKIVLSSIFSRNPDVVAETLYRANGICADCNNVGSFIAKRDNKPFLEVHHVISLADGGKDTLDNTVALCPNCHRKRHHG